MVHRIAQGFQEHFGEACQTRINKLSGINAKGLFSIYSLDGKRITTGAKRQDFKVLKRLNFNYRSGLSSPDLKDGVSSPKSDDKIEIGTRRADFIVAEKVVVELKALTKLDDTHIAQGKNYLEAFRFEIGLLINFGGKSLEHIRLFNSNKKV